MRDSSTLELVLVEGYIHPKGCMGARFTHLDLPFEPLKHTVLGALASPRGGVKLPASAAGPCIELEPPLDVTLTICVEGLDVSGEGTAYLTMHREGWIYLSLPWLDLEGSRHSRCRSCYRALRRG